MAPADAAAAAAVAGAFPGSLLFSIFGTAIEPALPPTAAASSGSFSLGRLALRDSLVVTDGFDDDEKGGVSAAAAVAAAGCGSDGAEHVWISAPHVVCQGKPTTAESNSG